MNAIFHDRAEAGRLLARKLEKYTDRADVVILALPRGGVPVAREVAEKLRAPMDVFVVRKLGVPGFEEFAMGAIASGEVCVLNPSVIASLRMPHHVIEKVAARERQELNRRELAYRGDEPPLRLAGHTVILIDDGVATGSTMLAAIKAIRKQLPAKIVVGVPVASESSYSDLVEAADEVVAVLVPELFSNVGQWYEDFSEVTDAEVRRLLRSSSVHAALPAAKAA